MKRTISNPGNPGNDGNPGDPSKPVPEQAAEWYVELDEPHGDHLRRAFFDWLKQSPRHIEEFLAIAEIERSIGDQSSSIENLVEEVRSATGRRAVAFVGQHRQAPGPERTGSRRWQLAALAAAAGVAAVAVLLSWQPHDAEAPVASHRTELGEQRSIALGDGSIMTLNTLTEAVVRFDDATRRVTLLNGEAMFEVASDLQRPFVVESGDLFVSVGGTTFSVYRKGRSARIAVVDGVVTASSNRNTGRDMELRGGEGAVFGEDGELRRDASFSLERAVAWTERVLMFENTRLADVVSEFNRYNRIQLRIDDAQLADRPVTLTRVNAHDVSSLVAFLRLQPDVRVEYRADTIRIGKAIEAR